MKTNLYQSGRVFLSGKPSRAPSMTNLAGNHSCKQISCQSTVDSTISYSDGRRSRLSTWHNRLKKSLSGSGEPTGQMEQSQVYDPLQGRQLLDTEYRPSYRRSKNRCKTESQKSRKLTTVVFSVIATFVLCMAPNTIINTIYLIKVRNHKCTTLD